MRKSRLSQHKQNKLIELLVVGVTARTTAQLVNVNKTTATSYFHCLRLLIHQHSQHLEMLDVSEFNYFRINHGTHFTEKQNHINGNSIENFEIKQNDICVNLTTFPKLILRCILKECEWCFNNSDLKSQISILKQLVRGSLV